MKKQLYKSSTNKTLCGVLGGIGEYLDIDPTVVRLVYVAVTIFSAAFPGLLLYCIMALIMPKRY